MGTLDLTLLSAMITPAVLISACGTLIFSTSTRLARIVDRTRGLTRLMEAIFSGETRDFVDERRHQIDLQLGMYAERGRLVQQSLTAFYVALGIFVGTTIAIGLSAFVPRLSFLPGLLGIAGTLELFRGCVLLIRETRISFRSVAAEMEFTLRLGELYQARAGSTRPGTLAS